MDIVEKINNWRLDGVLGGLGLTVTTVMLGDPNDYAVTAWIGFFGFLVGLLVSLAIGHVAHLRFEAQRLQAIEQNLEGEKKQRNEERILFENQIAIAKREAAINAVDVEVWGGAFGEAKETGRILPLSAILARREVIAKSKNLHLPLHAEGTGNEQTPVKVGVTTLLE